MRYRYWNIFILLLVLLLTLALPVSASEYEYVFDDADILTAEEEALLEETAGEVSARTGCGVYIVTMWDYMEYGGSVRNAAESFFLTHDLGLGSDDNGVLLLLSMAERDYSLIAHGDLGNSAFTDYGKDLLSEEFLDDFRYDDWYAGFADYVSVSDKFLDAALSGEPVDVGAESGSGIGMTLIIVLLVPALIAGIACGIMAASMKTARQKTQADDYQKDIRITNRHDRFLTRTVVRQKIESSSSSSGGGTRVNSGGFSGKSGKF